MPYTRAADHRFTLRHIDGVPALAEKLAGFLPCPDQFMTGIYELLMNAIEHGNLGIGFETKSELIRQNKWRQEISHRLVLPDYRDRQANICLFQTESESRLSIADEGQGFAWKKHFGKMERGSRPNGRGLWIVFKSKFDRVIFSPAGNEVTCVIQHDQGVSRKD